MVILMDIDKEPRRCCGAFVLRRKRWWAGDKGVLQYKWLCAQWRWCVPGCYDLLRQSQVQDTQDCQHPWPDAGCQRLTLPEVRRQLQKQGYKSAEIKEHGIVLCSFSIACFAIWVGSFSENKRLRSPCEPKNAVIGNDERQISTSRANTAEICLFFDNTR